MMIDYPLRSLLFVGIVAAAGLAAVSVRAQQQPVLSPDEEISPRQVQTVPATRPRPRTSRAVQPGDNPAAAGPTGPASNPARAAAQSSSAARAIACNGMFAKDSSHIKLAEVVGATNIEFGEVAGAEGTKLNASILYPKDPKRRLEVLWQNEAARSDTALIVITGQSQWRGPKGLRLGLALVALEKLNGRPFKLSGFDQPDGSAVLDWQDGALAQIPGGCQIGVKLVPDRKATPDMLAAAVGKGLLSSDAVVRAAKPTIGEIIVGYQ